MTISASQALDKVAKAFGGKVEARDDEIRVTHKYGGRGCGHRGLWLKRGTQGKLVIGFCQHCQQSAQDDIDHILENENGIQATATETPDAQPDAPPAEPLKPAPLGWPPGWEPIKQ